MSFDDPQENQAWAEEHEMPFELWTDANRQLALAYGAATSPTQSSARRVTVLLDSDGEVWLEYPVVIAGTHPGQVLQDVRQLLSGTTP